MTGPLVEGWYYIEITLKSLLDGITTKTLKLSNRPIIEEADGETVYYPILKAISNVGTELGDYIPEPHSGAIIIDNSPHSFGYARKFSDLLEQYTVLGQPIAIYSASTTIDDTTIGPEFVLDWTTTGLTWEISGRDLRINVSEKGLSNKVLTKTIDPDGFPDAPPSSLGRFLPIIFGDSIPVKPIQVSSSQFAYGSTFAGVCENSGVAAYYAKNSLGIYDLVASPAATSTALFQQSGTPGSSVSLVGLTYATILPGSGSNSNGYILRGGRINLDGNSTIGTVSGVFKIQILRSTTVNGIPSPVEELVEATAQVNKANYSSEFQGSSDFWIEFSFNKPAVISANTHYWVTFSGSNEVLQSLTNPTIFGAAAYTAIKDETNSNFRSISGGDAVVMEFYGVKFTDSPSGGAADSEGLGHSYYTLDQKTAATGQTNPDLTKIDLVVLVNGLTDDGSGTVTGSAGARIRSPQHAIKALDLQWNGATWSTSGSLVDLTEYSTALTAHGETSNTATTKIYPRQIGGYSEGRKTAAELMREVCRNSAHKIGRYNGATKQFTLWPWGSTEAAVATITDEDSRLLGVRSLGSESVINRIVLQYARDIRYSDFVASVAGGSLTSYAKNLIYDIDSNTTAELLSSISVALYGRNELSASGFDFISNNLDEFADAMAQYYLRVNAYPFTFVDIEVPLFKYRSLNLFNVIEIAHPGLPSFYGSDPNAALPYYDGSEVDLISGNYWKRAKRYRAQIEGRVLNYNIGTFPTMRLNCRLLLNTGNDPT